MNSNSELLPAASKAPYMTLVKEFYEVEGAFIKSLEYVVDSKGKVQDVPEWMELQAGDRIIIERRKTQNNG